MRAVVCTHAIFSRFTKSAARMRAPMSWDLLPSTGHGATTEKGSSRQPKVTDHYVRENRQKTATFSTVLLTVTVFVFFVWMVDTAWNTVNGGSLGDSTATGLPGRQTGRALQSSTRGGVDLEARQRAGALHGMGVTFRTGSRAMNELVVAHLAEQTTGEELRMFLRTLHRSGATARADVVLLFPWSLTSDITRVIDEEDGIFQQLILDRQGPHRTRAPKQAGGEADRAQELGMDINLPPSFKSANLTISPFNAKAFRKSREERKGRGEIIWDSTVANGTADMMSSVDWADWGSIVGFEMQDLDQDEVLKGFIEDAPAQLRRWICYQMLLGMTKSKYRSVLLTEVRGVFILRDVLAVARKKAFNSGINLYQKDLSWNVVHHARKKRLSSSEAEQGQDTSALLMSNGKINPSDQAEDSNARNGPLVSDEKSRVRTESLEMHFIEEVYGKEVWKSLEKEDRDRPTLSSGFILGSMKPVRIFSSAVLTEIAALALKRKSRNPFHDGAILNHLVQKSSVLSRRSKMHLLSNNDSPVHSLPGSKQASSFFRDNGHGFAALIGLTEELMPEGEGLSIAHSIQDEICSSQADSWAYGDCLIGEKEYCGMETNLQRPKAFLQL